MLLIWGTPSPRRDRKPDRGQWTCRTDAFPPGSRSLPHSPIPGLCPLCHLGWSTSSQEVKTYPTSASEKHCPRGKLPRHPSHCNTAMPPPQPSFNYMNTCGVPAVCPDRDCEDRGSWRLPSKGLQCGCRDEADPRETS